MSFNKLVANNPILTTQASAFIADLKKFAHLHLPDVMIPARFIILNKLPKLPNGKVDRNQLTVMSKEEINDNKYVAPKTREEIRIAEIWRDLLGINKVSVEDSFFDLGGNSLSVVQMAIKIRDEYNLTISLREFLKNPTVTTLAQMLGTKKQLSIKRRPMNLNDDELLSEARLPADVTPELSAIAPSAKPYQSILLTGGTGYTGAFLLRELLDRSKAEIYIIVRAENSEDAIHRIQKNMTFYGVWHDADKYRLKGIVGDIGRPYFGLCRQQYGLLAEQVEMIVHNAALSSFAMPYSQLKPINVLGTLEVLRLACRKRVKPVHYISSLAVFPGHKGIHHFAETELLHPSGLAGGYRQSKWVADRLITLAGHRGLPVCIYRPGQITGATNTGKCSTDTYLNAAIKGCIQLGLELEFDITLEITPVDYCAAAIAHISLNGNYNNTHFHLAGARSVHWREVMHMIRTYGYSLRAVSYQTWYRELAGVLNQGEENEMSRFFPLFGEDTPSADAGDEGSQPYFETKKLQSALADSGIQCRTLDQEFLSLYLDYFISIGFLQPPTRE